MMVLSGGAFSEEDANKKCNTMVMEIALSETPLNGMTTFLVEEANRDGQKYHDETSYCQE